MTEIKKPSPGNKHETRLSTESRPAGIAPSTYKEGPSGSVDMIEVVGEKPRVVRIAQGAYDTMVRDGTQYYGRNFSIAGAMSQTVWVQIGVLTVPVGMVLDVTSVRFLWLILMNPGAGVQTYYPAPNDYLFLRGRFRVRIGEVMPWDQYEQYSAGAAPNPGWHLLNEEYLQFMECPVHLIGAEGQTIRFEWQSDVVVASLPELNTSYIAAYVRGRWIPIQHYNRIVGANALE